MPAMGEGQRELLLPQGRHRGTEETPSLTRTAGDCQGLLTRLPAKPLSHLWALDPCSYLLHDLPGVGLPYHCLAHVDPHFTWVSAQLT